MFDIAHRFHSENAAAEKRLACTICGASAALIYLGVLLAVLLALGGVDAVLFLGIPVAFSAAFLLLWFGRGAAMDMKAAAVGISVLAVSIAMVYMIS